MHQPQGEKRLIDLSQQQLRELKVLINKGVIKTYKDLMPELMQRINAFPDEINKLFASYIESQNTPITWDTILDVMEEETNKRDKLRDNRMYGQKKIFLKEGGMFNFSKDPFRLFHPQHTIDFISQLIIKQHLFYVFVVSGSTMVILDEKMSKIVKKIDFARVYEDHFHGKLFKQQLEDPNVATHELMLKIKGSELGKMLQQNMGQFEKQDSINSNKNRIRNGQNKTGLNKSYNVRASYSVKAPSSQRLGSSRQQSGGDRRRSNKLNVTDSQVKESVRDSQFSRTHQGFGKERRAKSHFADNKSKKSLLVNKYTLESMINYNDFNIEKWAGVDQEKENKSEGVKMVKRQIKNVLGFHGYGGQKAPDLLSGKNNQKRKTVISFNSQRKTNNYLKPPNALEDNSSENERLSIIKVENQLNFSAYRDKSEQELSFRAGQLNTGNTMDQNNVKNSIQNSQSFLDNANSPQDLYSKIQNRRQSDQPNIIEKSQDPKLTKRIGMATFGQGYAKPDAAGNFKNALLRNITGHNPLIGQEDSYFSRKLSPKDSKKISSSKHSDSFDKPKLRELLNQRKGAIIDQVQVNHKGYETRESIVNTTINAVQQTPKLNMGHVNPVISTLRNDQQEVNQRRGSVSNRRGSKFMAAPDQPYGRPSAYSIPQSQRQQSVPVQRSSKMPMPSQMGKKRRSGVRAFNQQVSKDPANIAQLSEMLSEKIYSKYGNDPFIDIDLKDRRFINTVFDMFKARTQMQSNIVHEEDEEYTAENKTIRDSFDEFDKASRFRVNYTVEDLPRLREMQQNQDSDDEIRNMSIEDQIRHECQVERLKHIQGDIDGFRQTASSFQQKQEVISKAVSHNIKTDEDEDKAMDKSQEDEQANSSQQKEKKRQLKEQARKQKALDFELKKREIKKEIGESGDNSGKGTKLVVVDQFFWEEFDVLFFSFISREIFAYDIEFIYDFEMTKISEFRTPRLPNKIHGCKSSIHDAYYFFIIEDFSRLTIYHLEDELVQNLRSKAYKPKLYGENKHKLLISNPELFARMLDPSRIIFKRSFGIISLIKCVYDSVVIVNVKSHVSVVKQCSSEVFKVERRIQVQSKTISVKISAVDLGNHLTHVLLGTASGFLFVYDIDIGNIVKKVKVANTAVIQIKSLQCINTIVVISQTKRIVLVDNQSFDILQVVEQMESKLMYNWAYITDLDNLFEEARRLHFSDTYDKAQQSIEKKNGKKGSIVDDKYSRMSPLVKKRTLHRMGTVDLQDEINDELIQDKKKQEKLLQLVVGEIDKKRGKVFVGGGEFMEFNFYEKKSAAFQEMVGNFNLLHSNEKSLQVGSDLDKKSFYKKVFNKNQYWKFVFLTVDVSIQSESSTSETIQAQMNQSNGLSMQSTGISFNPSQRQTQKRARGLQDQEGFKNPKSLSKGRESQSGQLKINSRFKKGDYDTLVLINDQKFIVTYSLDRDLILSSSMINLQGEICQARIAENGVQIMIGTKKGEAGLFGLQHIKMLKFFKFNLSHLTDILPLMNEISFLALFNSPNELYFFQNIGIVKQRYEIEDVHSCKDQIKSIKFEVPFLISELKGSFIFVLLENLELQVIKHKNQRVMKVFNLSNKLPMDVIYAIDDPAPQSNKNPVIKQSKGKIKMKTAGQKNLRRNMNSSQSQNNSSTVSRDGSQTKIKISNNVDYSSQDQVQADSPLKKTLNMVINQSILKATTKINSNQAQIAKTSKMLQNKHFQFIKKYYFKDQSMFLQFEKGAIVRLRFSENFTSRCDVFILKGGKNHVFACSLLEDSILSLDNEGTIRKNDFFSAGMPLKTRVNLSNVNSKVEHLKNKLMKKTTLHQQTKAEQPQIENEVSIFNADNPELKMSLIDNNDSYLLEKKKMSRIDPIQSFNQNSAWKNILNTHYKTTVTDNPFEGSSFMDKCVDGSLRLNQILHVPQKNQLLFLQKRGPIHILDLDDMRYERQIDIHKMFEENKTVAAKRNTEQAFLMGAKRRIVRPPPAGSKIMQPLGGQQARRR